MFYLDELEDAEQKTEDRRGAIGLVIEEEA
jgi:hypothetical protein